MNSLVNVIQRLSLAKTRDEVVEIVRHAARALTGADGATFVLRDGDKCWYVDEDAISPLWKGKRFPMEACISGWSMLHRQSAMIEDIYQDPRIPAEAYRPTFVKSLVMVPIRTQEPIGAIGNYWARPHRASEEEIEVLQALADSTSVALENVRLFSDLKAQLRLRDEFISIAAHELKTPLTPLKLQFEFLRRMTTAGLFRGHPREKDFGKLMGIVGRQVGEFAKLVDNLLDVSRIQLGMEVLHLDDVDDDLGRLVQSIVNEYPTEIRSRIETSLDDGIQVRWDREKIGQVLRNLLSNAIKFGKDGPIRVTASENNGEVQLAIEDHGIGIAKEDQERIFERFERAVSIHAYGGIGIGLYVSRDVVSRHHGRIRVESDLGKGARFIVELPARPTA